MFLNFRNSAFDKATHCVRLWPHHNMILLRNLCRSYMKCLVLSLQYAIAVVDFGANNISKGEVKALTDRLRVELFRTKHFKVIEREMMEEILQEQGFQQSGCTTDECMVQIGRLIGVEVIVGGSISKVGKTFTVSTRIVSVETGDILNSASYDHRGEIDGLLNPGMKEVAISLIK